jgi:hypothetical protein
LLAALAFIPSRPSRCFYEQETLHTLLKTGGSRNGFESVSISLREIHYGFIQTLYWHNSKWHKAFAWVIYCLIVIKASHALHKPTEFTPWDHDPSCIICPYCELFYYGRIINHYHKTSTIIVNTTSSWSFITALLLCLWYFCFFTFREFSSWVVQIFLLE